VWRVSCLEMPVVPAAYVTQRRALGGRLWTTASIILLPACRFRAVRPT
jgi:hypothetical protein